MKNIVSAKAMQDSERQTFKGVKDYALAMEKAGTALFAHIQKYNSFLIFCGAGNNGGDGFVCARLLRDVGKQVEIVIVGDIAQLSSYAYVNYQRVCELAIQKEEIKEDYACVVDAIFGIGFHGTLFGEFLEAVNKVNSFKGRAHIVACDIPSGLNATNGIGEECVDADETVTFQAYKLGQIIGMGADYCGKITVEEIGISISDGVFFVEKNDIFLPKMKKTAHKGTRGHIGVIGGSRGMEGAAEMCAYASLNSGAGLVSILTDSVCEGFYNNRHPEIMLDTKSTVTDFIKNKSCVVFGCGIGRSEKTRERLYELIERCTCPLIIDADGLYYLTPELLKKARCNITLTPHMGEAARLFNVSLGELLVRPHELAADFAKNNSVTVLLKSNYNFITDGTKRYFTAFGCPAMATAGSGDALAGITTGATLLTDSLNGAMLASFLHGFAGNAAQNKKSPYSVTATDIISEIYTGFNELNGGSNGKI